MNNVWAVEKKNKMKTPKKWFKQSKVKKDTSKQDKEVKAEIKKVKKSGIVRRQMLLSLMPVIIAMVVSVILSAISMKGIIQNEVENSLRSSAIVIERSYDSRYPGQYKLDDSGRLFKGAEALKDDNVILDQILKKTDIISSLYYGDTVFLTSYVSGKQGRRIIGNKADSKAVEKVLTQGEEFFDKNWEIDGEKYFAYYYPIMGTTGEPVGMFFTAQKRGVVQAKISKSAINLLLIGLIIVILTSIVIVPLAKHLVNGLDEVEKNLQLVAKGNLGVKVADAILKRPDEIGSLAVSTEQLNQSLTKMVGSIVESSGKLDGSASGLQVMSEQSSQTCEEVSKTIQEIANGINIQAEETKNVNDYIKNMGEEITSISEKIQYIKDNSENIDRSQKEANSIIKELESYNGNTLESVEHIGTQAFKTDESVKNIQSAVQIITSIADQTNLLSLNASIEAARAGDAGRGFAVVAKEIQVLAEQCNKSAKEIENIASQLVENSSLTVDAVKVVKKNVDEQNNMLLSTKAKIKEINQMIEESDGAIGEINGQIETLNGEKEHILNSAQNLSDIAEGNAAGIEETTASVQEMNASSQELAESAKALMDVTIGIRNEINQFKF